MIIKVGNNIYKAQIRKNSETESSKLSSSKSFEDIIFSSIVKDEEVERIGKRLDELEERLKGEFSSQIVEEYKVLIRDLIKKLNTLVSFVEKSSLRSKDKKLRVMVMADKKLREMLEKMVNEHINKAVLMNISFELKGIIMSILA